MKKYKRIFTIVIDSFGAGEMPDAAQYGDEGTDTMGHISQNVDEFTIPNLQKLGIANLHPLKQVAAVERPMGYYTFLKEASTGKDTMTGHWEMMGLHITKPFKTFTETGFPKELIDELEKRTGHKVIGNKSSSGTEILDELAEEEIATGHMIVYTSADSVLQICGNEETFGLDELYRCCEIAEELRIMKERSRIDSDEFDNIFGDRVYDRYKQNIDVVRTSLEELEKVRERILSRGEEKYQLPGEWRGGAGTGLSGLFRYEKTWENIADSIANMQVQTRHSTWFRSAKYQSLGSLLPELFTDGEVDMDALRQFVEEGGETFQHLARENQEMLREMVDDWETYEEALTAVRDYLQDIFGDLGSTLTDALVDAFENGTDAANTFVDSVGQALRLLGKRMASSIVFGKLFEDTQKRIEKVMQSDLSDEERFAQWSETMKSLVSGVMDQQDDFNRLWEEFRRIAKENGFSIDEEAGTSQQNGKAGATQTVTQDSFSRVEGLVTSVQIHSANIDENTEGIVPVLKGSLEAMNAIRENTEPIPQIYELLQTIKRDGLKAI